jgi:rubrerythrin
MLTEKNDPKNLASFINCLSLLENNAFLLYKQLADKVEVPLVKSFLLQIAIDSQKHSIVLKGVSESIAKLKGKPKECRKKVGETWRVTQAILRETEKKERIPEGDLPQLAEKLSIMESIMGEEYYQFVQLKTLKLMMKEINQIYNIDLSSVKKIFLNIIRDEETHRELLEKIKELIKRKEEIDATPVVKYRNPDSWSRPLPPTS